MALFGIQLLNRVTGAEARAHGNENNEQIVARGLPDWAEMTRKGQGWTIRTTTLLTSTAAYPTTTAHLELWNNNPGYQLVVADLFGAQVLATAVSTSWALFAQCTTVKAIPSFTALDMFSLSGRNKVTTVAQGPLVTGVGTTIVDNGFKPYGAPMAWGTAAATPGSGGSQPVNGMLIIPPGCSLAVAVMNSVATASAFQVGATVYWEKLTVNAAA